MAEGRGSSASIVLMLLFCILEFHSTMVHANTYKVGDARGWSFNVLNWPNGKSFKAGDTLVFSYHHLTHNVVVVDKAGYNLCNPLQGSRVYFSGNDRIQLSQGMNYFICGFPGHCYPGGMKIAVNAT